METTTDRSAVGRGDEAQLIDLLLNGRTALSNGPNGRPKAPPQKVASTRKMIRQGLCCPFRHLLEVNDADIDDDVPLSEVNAPYYRIIARNEARAADRHLSRSLRPVPVLTPRVQQEMGELTLALLRQASSPESVEAMEAVLREAADIPPVLHDLTRAVGLHVVRATTRPVHGARRSLEISR